MLALAATSHLRVLRFVPRGTGARALSVSTRAPTCRPDGCATSPGRLVVRLETATRRFHRDLPRPASGPTTARCPARRSRCAVGRSSRCSGQEPDAYADPAFAEGRRRFGVSDDDDCTVVAAFPQGASRSAERPHLRARAQQRHPREPEHGQRQHPVERVHLGRRAQVLREQGLHRAGQEQG